MRIGALWKVCQLDETSCETWIEGVKSLSTAHTVIVFVGSASPTQLPIISLDDAKVDCDGFAIWRHSCPKFGAKYRALRELPICIHCGVRRFARTALGDFLVALCELTRGFS